MAKTWTAPVLEELSIPAGTYGSVDDPNAIRDSGGPGFADNSPTAS
jgi:hypothetical protein